MSYSQNMTINIFFKKKKPKPKWSSVLTPPGRSYTNIGILSDILVETFLESFAFWEHWLFNYVLLFRPRCQQVSTRRFTAINIVHGVGGYSTCYKERKVINTATNPMTNSNDLWVTYTCTTVAPLLLGFVAHPIRRNPYLTPLMETKTWHNRGQWDLWKNPLLLFC